MLTRRNVKVKGRLWLLIIKSNVHFNSKTLICFLLLKLYWWLHNIISEYVLNTQTYLLCNKQSSGDLIGGYVFEWPCVLSGGTLSRGRKKPNMAQILGKGIKRLVTDSSRNSSPLFVSIWIYPKRKKNPLSTNFYYRIFLEWYPSFSY